MVTTAPEQVVLATSGSTTSSLSFTTTALIPAGRVIIIAANRIASANVCGIQTVTTSAGAVTGLRRLGNSCRASTYDVSLLVVVVSTAIPAGSTITCTWTGTTNRYGAVLSVWSNITRPVVEDALSGTGAYNQAGTISAPSSGSSSIVGTSTTTAMPAGDHLVISAHSYGGAQTISVGAGMTEVGRAMSTVGNTDRGILLQYKIDSASGTKIANATTSTNAGFAASIATLPLSQDVVPTMKFRERSGSGYIDLVAKERSGSGWVTLTPEEL